MPTSRHARLGPSSSEIWLSCLGAPAEWLKRPGKRVGFAAHEGSLAHALCEAALQIHEIPWKAGTTFPVEGSVVEVTPDMLNSVQLYVNTVNVLSDLALWRMIESEVSLAGMWTSFGEEPPEDVYGTLDFAACDQYTLYILDFKYGAGKAVKVDFNTQLMIYAVACLFKLQNERPDLFGTIENVCLAIVQPRAGGDPVRQWTISVGDLFYWAYSVLKPSIENIVAGKNIPLVAGDWCFFCAASLDCVERKRYKMIRSLDSFPTYDPTTEDLDFAEEQI